MASRDYEEFIAALNPSVKDSQRAQERHEIAHLLRREPDGEAGVVEVHDGTQVRRRAVVEVRGARGEPAQHRALRLADVGPLATEHRLPWVGYLHDGAGGDVLKRVDRQVRDIEHRV